MAGLEIVSHRSAASSVHCPPCSDALFTQHCLQSETALEATEASKSLILISSKNKLYFLESFPLFWTLIPHTQRNYRIVLATEFHMLCMTITVCSLFQSRNIHSKQEYIGEKKSPKHSWSSLKWKKQESNFVCLLATQILLIQRSHTLNK